MATDPRYGGQAIIEGVMIRGIRYMAMAVRSPGGQILVRRRELTGLYTGLLREVPFIRGVIILWETLVLGLQALVFSSTVAAGGDAHDLDDSPGPSDKALWLTVLLSLTVVGILFFAGPVILTHWLERFVPGDVVILIEGLLRLTMLIGYIGAIGFLPDMRRVFAYHGAEHMAISAWEHKRPLTIETVRTFGPAHPRCGTAFLLTVMIIAVAVFITLGTPPFWFRALSRIALIPVIAGIAYEVIRLAARYHDQIWAQIVAAPNLALQRLTTRRPEDDQIEVAIAALQEVLAADGVLQEVVPEGGAIETSPT